MPIRSPSAALNASAASASAPTRTGWPATVMAASAFGSAAEWAGCAVVPALVCVLIAAGTPPVRVTAGCYAAVCGV